MIVWINPSKAAGQVCAPPSKSVAHRALICGALSAGSAVHNLAMSEDIAATLSCLTRFGASAEEVAQTGAGKKVSAGAGSERAVPACSSDTKTFRVGGWTLDSIPEDVTVDCRESGSTLRFLIPFAMLSGRTVRLVGSERLMQRPLGIYREISRRNNGVFELSGRTLTIRGGLKAGVYEVPGNISSQFLSGLMMSLPLADGESRIRITGPIESGSYLDITTSVLADFGVTIRREGDEGREIVIPGGATYDAREYTVEGDCSNAAFLEALAMLSDDGEGEKLAVSGVPEESRQGDRVYREMLRGLAAGRKEFDLTDCPDLAPCLFAMAAYCGGAHFTGTARLAIKESDRAAAMAEELGRFGAKVTVGANEVTVRCEKLRKPDGMLSGHNDHRVVMALSLLCTVTGGGIDGAEAVAKSYPDWFRVIERAGIALSLGESDAY
ncbi:MAG: 3-phosphoshikimate 1-carboxyvinyltransferase [Lachnospiraceae bacterium]|nr:3-phosphoshikimate 1-carboxyvinyltransferase [Lachnospiraceae bacterium]